jgi:GAF domain-containing protein
MGKSNILVNGVTRVSHHEAHQRRLSKLSDRAFSLALMESEGRVLEAIARGGPLERLLSDLVLAIERLSSGMRGSVLLLDADGVHLRHGAAPHLPLAYRKAIDGVRIGRAAGSCGTAAVHTGKPVIVVDIQKDPRWRPYRQLAAQHGLRACWSTPIFSRDRRVLGAFALYYDQVRSPGERDKRLVQIASDLAAIAIERDMADRRLEAGTAGGQSRQDTGTPAHRKLSARELEVFRRIAHGESVKRIARTLDLSISTVYTHRARIFEKLGVRSNVALARYAVAQDAAY